MIRSPSNTWREMVEKADAYKATGQTEIYLDREDFDALPWELVREAGEGGSYRNDIPVSISFEGVHPSGLTFKWFWNLETYDANGRSGYWLDVPHVLRTLERLPEAARPSFLAYLKRVADAIDKQADDALAYVQKQYAQSHLLRRVIGGEA